MGLEKHENLMSELRTCHSHDVVDGFIKTAVGSWLTLFQTLSQDAKNAEFCGLNEEPD